MSCAEASEPFVGSLNKADASKRIKALQDETGYGNGPKE